MDTGQMIADRIEALISERTSSTVKAALADLLSVPTSTKGKGQQRRGRAASKGEDP